MTYLDLSPVMRKVYDNLSPEEQVELLREQDTLQKSLIRAAIAQVQARNNSHNIGKFVKIVRLKK